MGAPRSDRRAPTSPAAVRRRPGTAAGVRGLTVSAVVDAMTATRRRGRRRLRPRARVRRAVRELLVAIGEDPDRDGLRETPERVARAYQEIFAGLWQEPEDVLTTTFDLGHDEMVLVKDIEVRQHLRAPPGAVLRRRARRLHPVRGRPDHRPVEAGPAGRRLRPPAAGAGAADHPGRRLADAHPRAARRDRRRRVRAPVHVDARHPQAGRQDRHVGGARPAARPRDPGRGHEPHRRAPVSPDLALPGAALPVARRAAGVADRSRPHPGHGRRQRHARLVLRRRRLPRRRRRGRARPGAGGRRRRPGRRRRRVDPARRGTGWTRPRSCAGCCRSCARLAAEGVVVSIDTMRASVAAAALEAGAALVNDVSGGLADEAMARVVADAGTPYVVMHWRGHSADMASRAVYADVVTEVVDELRGAAGRAVGSGRRPRPGRGRPGPRLRQGRRAQLVAAGPPGPAARARPAGARRRLAQGFPRPAARRRRRGAPAGGGARGRDHRGLGARRCRGRLGGPGARGAGDPRRRDGRRRGPRGRHRRVGGAVTPHPRRRPCCGPTRRSTTRSSPATST